MDKIFIHALKTEAIIGIFDWERQVKQTVIVDIEIGADIRKAAQSDSIEDTLNYKRVAKRVLAFVEGSKFHLVETLAEHVAMLILDDFGIAWVRISLSKPGAPKLSAKNSKIVNNSGVGLMTKGWRAISSISASQMEFPKTASGVRAITSRMAFGLPFPLGTRITLFVTLPSSTATAAARILLSGIPKCFMPA